MVISVAGCVAPTFRLRVRGLSGEEAAWTAMVMVLATLAAVLPAGRVAAQTTGWSATLTVDVDGGYTGCDDADADCFLRALSDAGEEDLGALLDGVTEIGAPGAPGPLCVYGPEAFPVIVGATQGGVRAPVAAASLWRAGRVVALGHDGYFQRDTLETADTGRLMTNALGWAAGEAGPRIGVVATEELRTWLTEAGHNVVETVLTPQSLRAVDVVALVMWKQSAQELDALSAFVRAGGGLVTAATGWGWAYLHPDLDLVNDYAGNRLLARVGIQWPDDWLERTSPEGYAVDGPPPALTHAGTALDAVEAHVAGERPLIRPEIDQALDTIVRTAGCLPPGDRLLAPRLAGLVESVEEDGHWPSAERPVTTADVIARLASAVFVIRQRRTPAESVRAHPAAADFPGLVPADALRLTRSVKIDTTVPRWHSTGLYAAPGELVTVTVPDEVGAAGGFQVRVGTHSDGIWSRPEWTRMPEISRRFPVSDATTPVANAFGGLIYVEVPVDADLGTITVEIEGAVAAPRYVQGETDPAVWRDEIRHAPAPWAEIEGRSMIVTTDAREVRDLDDPATVATTWDRVLDLDAELAAWPSLARSNPERFVVDRQISVGYMHAGYPLMAHMDQSAHLVDAMHISTCRYDGTQSNWGFFHEVGHNHQSDDWTFDGTVEVTVNLFTLYVYEFLCGIPVAQNWRGSAAFRAEQMARYDFDSPDFEQWKLDPFLALVMYEQLQQAFGWEAYRQVFATYRALADEERPNGDDEKRDQWLVRFSRQVGRNLGPFFETWGVPTSQEARDSIADLPEWMPPNFPPRNEERQASALSSPGAAPTAADPSEPLGARTRGPATVLSAVDGTRFRVETVVTGLRAPASLDFAPDGRLFVADQEGRVWIVSPGRRRPELALAAGDAAATSGASLLDLALDPAFSDNGFVYLLQAGGQPGDGPASRLVRYREIGSTLAQATVLLDDLRVAASPTGGRLRFGPDGLLYAAMPGSGDADEAQDLASYAGKVLRVRPDGGVPGTNPLSSPVYSLGHLGPGGFDWHPVTGTLWAIESGRAGSDEVNRIEAGADYGWPAAYGMHPPVLSLSPSIAPLGASFYSGTALAGFRNDLFVAALDGGGLLRIRFDPSSPNRIIATERLLDGLFGRLSDVATGPDGGLYVTTNNRNGNGTPAFDDDRVIRLTSVRQNGIVAGR